jgi:ribosome maturation factor RimP
VSTNAIRGQLVDLLTPVVAAEGLDLEDVAVNRAGSRSVVRVVVDADGGLDLDAVAEVSRSVSAVLDDADDVLRGAYVLEVTSPGVDRPLTAPRHWRRAKGRKVRVLRADGREVVGRLVETSDSEDGDAALETDSGVVRVSYADVRKATVEIEFAPAGSADKGAEKSAL